MTRSLAANASATRSFFVDMLVRDISVDAAILDLIDNAVDAAYANSTPDGPLNNFHVEVKFGSDSFEITDNCGGIDIEIAKNYAFRFGRADDFKPKTRIGEFGIGMKRAVFRIGAHFIIDSSTNDTQFTVDVDVDSWREQDGDWTFPMTQGTASTSGPGTTVRVSSLHKSVAELFSRDAYGRKILSEIKERYSEAINSGLEITLNEESASLRLHKLLVGREIVAENQVEDLFVDDLPVNLRIVAGIGPEGKPTESGWYVYCNGRLVVKADRTALTGWGTATPDGDGVPAWHPQFARFRGFVFFKSESPGALPWTTTKTEIDESSEVYRNALGKMRSVIRSFTTYTNDLKQERNQFEESHGTLIQPIATAQAKATLTEISEVPYGGFRIPDLINVPVTPPSPKTTRIQFDADASAVDELKDVLRMKTNRQIGEEAFERLYDEEIG